MERLTEVVKDLMMNHGIKHRNIVKHVRETVRDMGKDLPKIKILYNCDYGGYGLSKDFQDFVHRSGSKHERRDSYDSRVDLVPYIKPYGNHILDTYPFVRNMLILYKYHNLTNIATTASTVDIYKGYIEKFEKRLAALETARRGIDTDVKVHDLVHSQFCCLHGYTPEIYEEAINKVNNSVLEYNTSIKEIEEKGRKYHPSAPWELYDDIAKVIKQFRSEEDDGLFKQQPQDKCFADTLQKKGQFDSSIWASCNQRTFNKHAMRYLYVKYYGIADPVNDIPTTDDKYSTYDFLLTKQFVRISEEEYDDLVNDVGLLCAASSYCRLDTWEVQQYLDWHVDDYDGKERITVD